MIIDPESGEVLDEVPEGEDNLALAVYRRDDAYRQEKAWEARRQAYDRYIIAHQEAKAADYGGIRATVKQRTYAKTDWTEFGRELLHMELTKDEWMATALQARSFETSGLPEDVRTVYAKHTEELPTKQWVETKTVLRRAP